MARSNSYVFIFCTFIAFGGFLFGYVAIVVEFSKSQLIGVSFPIATISVLSQHVRPFPIELLLKVLTIFILGLIMPDFIQRFGTPDGMGGFVLDASRQSLITSLLSVGTFVGALAQAFTADSLGRKYSILLWSVIFTIGVTIQTATVHSIAQLCIGRVIAGLGVGALSALVPLLNGEAAPKHYRGTLVVLYQVMIAGGLFLSYIIDLGSHTVAGSASWRIPVGLQMLWGLTLIIGIMFLPESPRHLLFKGRTLEARQAISKLNACQEGDELVDDIMAELEEGLTIENEGGKAGWMECFAPEVRSRTINGMMIQFLQQLNGQNFYYYYGAVFFQSSGTNLSPYAIQALLGGVSFAMIFPALYLIETTGRRKVMLLGSVTEGVCALIAALVGHFMLAPTGTAVADLTSSQLTGGKVLVAFAILHVSCFSLFWGASPWVALSELFPMRVRPKCIALGAATNWLWNFLLGFFAPKIAADIGSLILLIFAGMLAVAFVYVFLFVHESKGLSLEQVDEIYRSNTKPWNSTKWEPTTGTTRKKPFERTYYPSEIRAMEAAGTHQELSATDAERIEQAKLRMAKKKGIRSHGSETKIDEAEHVEKAEVAHIEKKV